MEYIELYSLDIQKYFSKEIEKLRQCSHSNSGVTELAKVGTYKLWVSAVKVMFDRDSVSRSTSEFLMQKYKSVGQNHACYEQKLNQEIIASLLLLAIAKPMVEQKVLFSGDSLPTVTASDLVSTIRRNFVDYGVVATFYSSHNYSTMLVITAKK